MTDETKEVIPEEKKAVVPKKKKETKPKPKKTKNITKEIENDKSSTTIDGTITIEQTESPIGEIGSIEGDDLPETGEIIFQEDMLPIISGDTSQSGFSEGEILIVQEEVKEEKQVKKTRGKRRRPLSLSARRWRGLQPLPPKRR